MNVVRLDRASSAPTCSEQIILGMAQLSPFGVSEQWLLRHCGDRHWSLIADAIGSSMAFRDDDGHPVYAAFCATSVRFQGIAVLGETALTTSAIFQVAPQRVGSTHTVIGANGVLATVQMITCFLRHDERGSNRSLLRSNLRGLEDLPKPPQAFFAFSEASRKIARDARAELKAAPIFDYTPNPTLDFNAVGLLYFPTFSQIAELAAPTQGVERRDVVYLGNVDLGESVSVSKSGRRLLLHVGPRLIGVVESHQCAND